MSTKNPLTDKSQFRGDILDRQFSVHYDPMTGMYSYDYADVTPEILTQLAALKFYRISSTKLADVEAEVSKLRKPTAAAAAAKAPESENEGAGEENAGNAKAGDAKAGNEAAGNTNAGTGTAGRGNETAESKTENATAAEVAEGWKAALEAAAANPDEKPLTERAKELADQFKQGSDLYDPLKKKQNTGGSLTPEEQKTMEKALRILVDVTRNTYLDASKEFLDTYNAGRNNSTIPTDEKDAYSFATDLLQKDSRLTELDSKEGDLSEAEQAEKTDLEEFFMNLDNGSELAPARIQKPFDGMRYDYARAVRQNLLATPKEEQTKSKLNDLQFFDAFLRTYESTEEGQSNMPKEVLQEGPKEKGEARLTGGKRKAHKTRKAHKKDDSKHTTRKQ